MLKSLLGSFSNQISFSTVKKALDENEFSLGSFLSNVTFEILTTPETSEEDKGKTLLWLFAREVRNHPEYFLAIWQQFQQQITLEDILVFPLQGAQQGRTILWLLAAGCTPENSQPFNLVWERFNSEFNLLTLMMPTSEGNGLSTVEILFNVTFFVDFSVFERFWQRFGNEVKSYHLSSPLKEGLFKGVNLLWFLADFAFKGKVHFFEEIWQKEGTFFSRESLTVRPEDPTQSNRTILWLLAFPAAKQKSKIFFEVWDKVKRELNFHDVTSPASCVNKISLFKILWTFQEGRQTVLEILAQVPGLPHESLIQELREMSPELPQFFQGIFVAKQKLYVHLDYLKKRKLLGIAWEVQEVSHLLTLGEDASQAGYVNANYEVYALLEDDAWKEAKSKAWTRIPDNSWFRVFSSPEEEAKLYINLATTASSSFFRETYLQTALYWATRIRDQNKGQLIDAVAYCFVTGKNDYDSSRPYLAPRLAANLEDMQFTDILNLFLVLKEQADHARELEPQARTFLTLASNVNRSGTAAAAAAATPISIDDAALLEAPLSALSIRGSFNK
jgi:hypothetical protein